MTERPSITPQLLAALSEAAPKRLVRKLDKRPELAEDWAWSSDDQGTTVRPSAEVTVQLGTGPLHAVDQLKCSCLLAPKCLHLLAVASRLSLSKVDADEEWGPTATASEPEGLAPLPPFAPAEAAVAAELRRLSIRLVFDGASAFGTLDRAHWLRAIHAARVAGLHRLGGAAVRLAESMESLRNESAAFTLEELVDEYLDVLESCRVVTTRLPATRERRGTARRPYDARGNLRLYGLFSEAVISRRGYAGVVTHLCDARGNFFTVNDVLPGGPERASAGYLAGEFSGLSLAHADLCRAGAFVSDATASPDGRLGRGKAVRAVGADGLSLDDELVSPFWRRSLYEQLSNQRTYEAVPIELRPAHWNLLFFDAQVVGLAHDALVLQSEGITIHALPPSLHVDLPGRQNLALLAAHPGCTLRVIARMRLDGPRQVDLLAIAGPLQLPPRWKGRVNIGLDPLVNAHFNHGGVPSQQPPAPAVTADPCDALRRRTHRALLGGRATLPPSALAKVSSECRRLERFAMPHAASRLHALAQAASEGETTIAHGHQRNADAFCRAWHAAALFLRRSRSELARQSWLS